ncbi:MAG: CDC48 family AAA ATPase [Promethearchaeota archaeon]
MANQNNPNTSKDEKKIILRVEELSKSSAGRSICRMDIDAMRKLGLSAGEIIEIIGKKSSPAIVFPSSRDRGRKIIRIDGLLRLNTGTAVGEYVTVRKAVVKPAIYVKLAFTQPGIQLVGGLKALSAALVGKPLKAGDLISVVKSNIARKRESLRGPLEELQKVMGNFFSSPVATIGEVRFIVKETDPEGIVQITKSTEIDISEEIINTPRGNIVTYDDIGGLGDVLQKIREMVELPLKHPELFQRVNIEPPKGVLLYGPPGTGKTLVAKAVSQESNAYFITINGPEVMSKFYGESEQNLKKIFKEAEDNAPSIIFIDEIDSIAPKRKDVTGEVERRVVAQLLGELDGLQGRGKIIVIGATNRVDSIDEALRRPGRFDREIEFRVPDRDGRLEIFQIHTRGMPLADDVDLPQYASVTHGFVGADIMSVCREAAMACLREILPHIDLDKPIPLEILDKLRINDRHFQKALASIEPSALREAVVDIPNVTWDDVGGLEDIQKELRETVEWPLKYPHLYRNAGIRPVNGIMLFGPPGCGKTLLAKAVANKAEVNFIGIKGPEIFSKWVGESERAIREIFRKARQSAPCIIYFDEFDSIAGSRGGNATTGSYQLGNNVVNQILTEMDGIEDRKGLIVIASTNRVDLIDKAMLRPGRFDRIIYCAPPDKNARYEILKVHTRKMNVEKPEDFDNFLKELAEKTEYYSGADLENLCREAGMEAIRDIVAQKHIDPTQDENYNVIIKPEHFERALRKILPSLNEEIIKSYEELSKTISLKRSEITKSKKSLYM